MDTLYQCSLKIHLELAQTLCIPEVTGPHTWSYRPSTHPRRGSNRTRCSRQRRRDNLQDNVHHSTRRNLHRLLGPTVRFWIRFDKDSINDALFVFLQDKTNRFVYSSIVYTVQADQKCCIIYSNYNVCSKNPSSKLVKKKASNVTYIQIDSPGWS